MSGPEPMGPIVSSPGPKLMGPTEGTLIFSYIRRLSLFYGG